MIRTMGKKSACLVSFLVVSLVVSGCAAYRPITDLRGIDRGQYEQDLCECQKYAEQVSPGATAGAGALLGAGLGAAVGLVAGSILGVRPGQLAGLGAALGGMHGAAAGAGSAAVSQREVIKNCLMNRGYSVLN